MGDNQPDIQRVIDISELLGIMEFVEGLPKGFQTYLGENGTTLSGGQRQRIAIARALYRNPEVLILDEATSSLDSASERHVQQAIDYFKSTGKTVIIIAHRLSTIFKADKIIVLNKGLVAEEGTHSSLMKLESQYYNLWKQQIPSDVQSVYD